MYNYYESTPIKIDYATVPTADEWRATLRYQELLKNASLAPPPPPPEPSASTSVPPPPPPGAPPAAASGSASASTF